MRSKSYRLAGLAVAVLVLSSGCTQVIASTALARPVGAVTSTGDGPACVASGLISCLMDIPPDSLPWRPQPTPVGILTVQQFVDHYYGTATTTQRDDQLNHLRALHLRSIARRNWTAGNADEADVLLLLFGSPAEAQDRALDAELAYRPGDGFKRLLLHRLDGKIVVYQTLKPDSQGYLRAFAFAYFGDVEMEMFFFSRAQVDTPTLTSWLRQQSVLLTSAH